MEPFNRLERILTRDLCVDLPLPWDLETPVKESDKGSLVRREWNKHREYQDAGAEEDLGLSAAVTVEGLEELMGTNITVTRGDKHTPIRLGLKKIF